MSAAKPHCFLCEDPVEPGEPFKLVQAYQLAGPSRTLPGKPGAAAGVRIVQRAVHYSCELEAVAAAGVAGAGDDAPELVVEGAEDEDLTRILTDHPELRVVGVAAAFAYAAEHRDRYAEFFEADGSLAGPGYSEDEAAGLPAQYRIPGVVVTAGAPAA